MSPALRTIRPVLKPPGPASPGPQCPVSVPGAVPEPLPKQREASFGMGVQLRRETQSKSKLFPRSSLRTVVYPCKSATTPSPSGIRFGTVTEGTNLRPQSLYVSRSTMPDAEIQKLRRTRLSAPTYGVGHPASSLECQNANSIIDSPKRQSCVEQVRRMPPRPFSANPVASNWRFASAAQSRCNLGWDSIESILFIVRCRAGPLFPSQVTELS